jgi:hypothetical protein
MILKKIASKILPAVLFFLFADFSMLLAGGKAEGELAIKVPTDNLSGISLWIVGLYNDDRALYSIIVLLTMAGIGIIIALIADFILKLLGLEVSKITHHE